MYPGRLHPFFQSGFQVASWRNPGSHAYGQSKLARTNAPTEAARANAQNRAPAAYDASRATDQ